MKYTRIEQKGTSYTRMKYLKIKTRNEIPVNEMFWNEIYSILFKFLRIEKRQKIEKKYTLNYA